MRRDEKLLIQEARALIMRVRQMQPFEMRMPMVGAASVSPRAARAILLHVRDMRHELIDRLNRFVDWVRRYGRRVPAARMQRKLTVIKMRFVSALFGYDVFADVLTQRSEHDNGIWLAGLDAVAEDALKLPPSFEVPPVTCYLEHGLGAAIRRAKTSLPGRRENPVAVIRIPRERMVGFGISSSLVHEVGHQAEMLMGLSDELKLILKREAEHAAAHDRFAMRCFAGWITEILADAWGISHLGIAAPRGLMGVLSLPSSFLFRMKQGDPHPMPWFRVILCLHLGAALYPDPQWRRFERTWERLYPIPNTKRRPSSRVMKLLSGLDPFIARFLAHRPRSLGGMTLGELLRRSDRDPARLRARFSGFRRNPDSISTLRPTSALAVLGQGFADHRLGTEEDSRAIARLLRRWALKKNTVEPTGSQSTNLREESPLMDAFALE